MQIKYYYELVSFDKWIVTRDNNGYLLGRGGIITKGKRTDNYFNVHVPDYFGLIYNVS